MRSIAGKYFLLVFWKFAGVINYIVYLFSVDPEEVKHEAALRASKRQEVGKPARKVMGE